MAILKLHEPQHAVGAILARRQNPEHDDLFIYVADRLIYAFYHENQTEVLTMSPALKPLIRALLAAL